MMRHTTDTRGTAKPRMCGCFYAVYVLVASVAMCEALFAIVWHYTGSGHTFDAPSAWVIERREQPAIRFDAHTGFRYQGAGTRHALVTREFVDYNALIYGNNLGFPDKKDFTPSRKRLGVPRIAVLGDSFSAAVYLETNWPNPHISPAFYCVPLS